MSYKILVNGPITRKIMSSILASLAKNTDAGGHSVFIGQVRADIRGAKRVRAIEYSAYEKSVEIIHSVGIVMAGEASLFVLVSAGHRHHAIDACSRVVEMIKATLPVWKKEIFEDNSAMWKENSLA